MSKWSVKCLAAAAAAGLMLGSVLPASAEESMIRQYETSQSATSVVADVENADLVIRKGTGNTIQVDSAADARGEYTYHFDLEDGVLNIRVEAGEGETQSPTGTDGGFRCGDDRERGRLRYHLGE